MPRIFLTVTTDLTYDQRMIRIATALTAAGYEVTLVGRERAESRSLDNRPYEQYRIQCRHEHGKLFYLEYNWRLYQYLKTQEMDGICAVDLDTILPVYFASKEKGIPRFFDAHEYFEEVPEVVHRPMIKAIWGKVGDFAIPKFDRAYTVCQSLATIFTEKYGLPFSVVRNLPMSMMPDESAEVNEELVKEVESLASKQAVILYQGALNAGRGLEQMIDAMEYVKGAVLVLAGDGDLWTELHAKVARQYLQEKVVFLGYVKPATLRAITPLAKLGLNLLENRGLSYYYSLANKTFDYIRAGVPAFHPDFPEYRRLIDEYKTGILIKSLDEQYLARKVNEFLDNEIGYNNMVLNCHLAAATYVWDREAEVLVRVYDGVFR